MAQVNIQGKANISFGKLLIFILFIAVCIYDGQYLLAAAVLYFAASNIIAGLQFDVFLNVIEILDLLNQRHEALEAKVFKMEVHREDAD